MRKAKEILRNVLKINGEITEKDYKLKVSVEDALKAINTALTIDVVVLQSEQFSLTDIYKIAQGYTEEEFIEMVKHLQG